MMGSHIPRPIPARGIEQIIKSMSSNKLMDKTNIVPAPNIGILHKTITTAANVLWCFIANIRSKSFKDVVTVGAGFVHISELLPDERLRQIASFTDFDGEIGAALVVTRNRLTTPHGPIQENVKQEDDDEDEGEEPPDVIILSTKYQGLIFLFIHWNSKSGRILFRTCTFPIPMIPSNKAIQMTVDQSSNFLVCSIEAASLVVLKLSIPTLRQVIDSSGHENFHLGSIKVKLSPVMDYHFEKLSIQEPQSDPATIQFLHHNLGPGITILSVLLKVKNRFKLLIYQGDVTRIDFQSPILNQNIDVDSPRYIMIPFQHSPGLIIITNRKILCISQVLAGSSSTHSLSVPDDAYLSYKIGSLVISGWGYSGLKNSSEGSECCYLLRCDGAVFVLKENKSRMAFNQPWAMNYIGIIKLSVPINIMSLKIGRQESESISEILLVSSQYADGQLVKVIQNIDGDFDDNSKIEILETYPGWISRTGLTVIQNDTEQLSLISSSNIQPYSEISELQFGYGALIESLFSYDDHSLTATSMLVISLGHYAAKLYFVSLIESTEVFLFDEQSVAFNSLPSVTLSITFSSDIIQRITSSQVQLFELTSNLLSGVVDFEDASVQQKVVDIEGEIIHACPSKVLDGSIIVNRQQSDKCWIEFCGFYLGEWVYRKRMHCLSYSPLAIATFNHHAYGELVISASSYGVQHCYSLTSSVEYKNTTISDMNQSQLNPEYGIESFIVQARCQSNVLQYFLLCGNRQGSILLQEIVFESGTFRIITLHGLKIGKLPVTLYENPSKSDVSLATSGDSTFTVKVLPCYSGYRLAVDKIHFYDKLRQNLQPPRNAVFCVENQISSPGIELSMSGFSTGNIFRVEIDPFKKVIPRKISLEPIKFATPKTEAVILHPHRQSTSPKSRSPRSRIDHSSGGNVNRHDLDMSLQSPGPILPKSLNYAGPGTPNIIEELDNGIIAVASQKWSNSSKSTSLLHIIDAKTYENNLQHDVIAPLEPISQNIHQGEKILDLAKWECETVGFSSVAMPLLVVGTAIAVTEPEGQAAKRDTTTAGKLYFYQIHSNSQKKVKRLTLLKDKSFSQPICAVAALSKCHLAVCELHRLIIIGLQTMKDNETGKTRLKFHTYAEVILSDQPTKLTTSWPHLYISTMERSFVAYSLTRIISSVDSDSEMTDFDDTGLRMSESNIADYSLNKLFSDVEARELVTHAVIPFSHQELDPLRHVVLLVDRLQNLSIINHPAKTPASSAQRYAFAHPPILKTRIPHRIDSLVMTGQEFSDQQLASSIYSNRPTALNLPSSYIQQAEPSPFLPSSVPVLGTSKCGTLMHFRLLKPEAALLLEFLERLVHYFDIGRERVLDISPFALKIGPYASPIRNSHDKQNHFVIDPRLRQGHDDTMGRSTVNGNKLGIYCTLGVEFLEILLTGATWETAERFGEDQAFTMPQREHLKHERVRWAVGQGNDMVGRIMTFVELFSDVFGNRNELKTVTHSYINQIGRSMPRNAENMEVMEERCLHVETHTLPVPLRRACEQVTSWLELVIGDVF